VVLHLPWLQYAIAESDPEKLLQIKK